MTWPEFWARFVTFVGGSTAIMAGVTWVCNKVITHIFNKRSADFEKKLEQDFEKFKLELQKEALEHEIQFGRVDQKVAESLQKVHTPLRKLLSAATNYVSPVDWSTEPSKEEKLKTVADLNKEFDDILLTHQLYIPPTLFKKTHALASQIAGICNSFSNGLRTGASITGGSRYNIAGSEKSGEQNHINRKQEAKDGVRTSGAIHTGN